MPQPPLIPESEWKVMKVLWASSPLAASEIIAALSHTEDWHPNTIKTLLSRLHKKKVVGVEKQKNLYLYRPLVSEAEAGHEIGEVVQHPTNPQIWGIKNLTHVPWRGELEDGTLKEYSPQKSVPLNAGIRLRLPGDVLAEIVV